MNKWDAKRVRKALTEAFKVLDATGGRIGHKPVRASMPEYALEPADIAEQKLAGTFHYGKMKAKLQYTSRQIAHMEIVMCGTVLPNGVTIPAWLSGDVQQCPDHRKKLLVGCRHAAWGVSGRQVCERFNWKLTSYQRHIDFAALVIANQLNKAGLSVW